MAIITLTTDLGTRDHYVGALKGALLSAIPEANIVDITHDIEPFNILHAAFVFRNCYYDFPEGTIHLIAVNLFYAPDADTVIVQQEGHSFVAADNGLFGLVWDEGQPQRIYRVLPEKPGLSSVSGAHGAFVQAARHLASGDLSPIAEKITAYRISRMTRPLVSEQYIRGSIVYFDRFGNAVVNIQKGDFERVANGRRFTIAFKRYADIDHISRNYASVDESEKLCFFNASGYLEIAINKGNVKQLLNLSYNDTVQIDFH
jgi:hypothetical protein